MTTAAQMAHTARKRSKARRDPSLGLFETHNLGVAAASVDTGAAFPVRTSPITFAATIEVTGASASGIIFEFGDDTTGTKLAIDSGDIYVAAGEASGTDGIDDSLTIASLGTTGARIRLVLAIVPGSGKARLWVDGTLSLRVQQSTPELLTNGWSSTNAGAVGAAHAGSASTQRGQAIDTAPSDFALVEPLRVYVGQVPRGFDV